MGIFQSKLSKRGISQLQKEIIRMNKKSNVPSGTLDDYLGVWNAMPEGSNMTLHFALSKHTSGDYYMLLLDKESNDIQQKLLINKNTTKSYCASDEEDSITLFIIDKVLTLDSEQMKMTTSKNPELTKSKIDHVNTFVNSEVYLTAPQLQVLLKNCKAHKQPVPQVQLQSQVQSQSQSQSRTNNIAIGEPVSKLQLRPQFQPNNISVEEPVPKLQLEPKLESLDIYVGPIIVNGERLDYIVRSIVDTTKFYLINSDINSEPQLIQQQYGAYVVYDPDGSSIIPHILIFPTNGTVVITVMETEEYKIGSIDNKYARTTEYTNYIDQYRAKWNI
jgi:hypothetical protein